MKNIAKYLLLSLTVGLLAAFSVQAQEIPSTAVPAGFGRYCSVIYQDGTWGMISRPSPNSDPCKELLPAGSNGKIQRAGLWAVGHKNNVLRTCDGDVGIYAGAGYAIIKTAYKDAGNKKNCVFTISPMMLRVFSRPYQDNPLPLPSLARVTNKHNYNFYGKPVNFADYGRQPNPDCPTSTAILRDGRQTCHPHGGYDLVMPTGTKLTAVADGIVREARWRDVTEFSDTNCKNKSPQGEMYVEHQIGSGKYAERFITYYAHLSKIDVKKGDKVTRGKTLAKSGDSGCSSEPHLHFAVIRTTNLSGYYRLDPTYTDHGYGFSSPHGLIDHFHWNAPRGVDPWATISLENVWDPTLKAIVKRPGAFSLWLWRDGEEPAGK
ncbi:MAG TPA: M23 family metallopeptidase [Pyrinomonadaceae bacterium]|nr:M23 family metallopeptidase [Pyrinomonadaceae bacterium]